MNKIEQWSIAAYEGLHSFRYLFGILVAVGLSYTSIKFNYTLGEWTASDPESKKLLPQSYALLDVALIFLVTMLVVGMRSRLLSLLTACMVTWLLALSLWAAFAYTVAVDARHAEKARDARIQELQTNIEDASATVLAWQKKLQETDKYATRFNRQLQAAKATRDEYQKELDSLMGTTPPALQVFEKIEASDFLQSAIRFAFGAALVLAPLLCSAVVAHEIKGAPKKKRSAPPKKRSAPKSKAKPTTRKGKERLPNNVVRYEDIKKP